MPPQITAFLDMCRDIEGIFARLRMTEQEWLTSTDPAAMLHYLLNAGNWEEPSAERTVQCWHDCVTERKLRLFACGCCRLVWDQLTDDAPCPRNYGEGAKGGYPGAPMDWFVRERHFRCPDCSGTGRINRSRRAVEVAERYADGELVGGELDRALREAHAAWKEGSNPAGLARYAASVNLQNALEQITRPGLLEVSNPTAQAALLRCVFGNPWRPVSLCGAKVKRTEPAPQCQCCAKILSWNDGTVPRMARGIYDTRDWGALPVLADCLEEAGVEPEEECEPCRGYGGRWWCRQCRGGWLGVRGNRVVRECIQCSRAAGEPVLTTWRDCPDCNGTGRVPNPLLAHLRGAGPHCRGCHVLDLL